MSTPPFAFQPELQTVFIDDFDKGVITEMLYKWGLSRSGAQRLPLISPNMPSAMPGMCRMSLRSHIGMSGMPTPRSFPIGPMGMITMNPAAMAPMNAMAPGEFLSRKKEFLKDKDSLSKDPIVVKRVAIT
jgi:hypothetical protein